MTTLTATVAKVNISSIEFEGLLLENGEYAIALQQVSNIFQLLPKSAQKYVNDRLGKDSSFYKKVKTNREDVEGVRARSAENALSLLQFEKLIRKLDREGNKTAQALVDDMVGFTLHQLFSDAFGVKFEKEERKAWLESRAKTKTSFWFLTDDIKDYLENHESNNRQFHYINAFKAMSVGLFGKTPSTIKLELNLTKGELNRDCFGAEALSRIDIIQKLARVNIINGLPPTESVKVAIATFNYKPIDYKD